MKGAAKAAPFTIYYGGLPIKRNGVTILDKDSIPHVCVNGIGVL